MLPTALAQREQHLENYFEFPESGTLPLAMSFVPEESESEDLENFVGNFQQSVTQPTNPQKTNMASAMLDCETTNASSSASGYHSQPDGTLYRTEVSKCCFCEATFTKLQQHMPNHHPYLFNDLMAADKPAGADVHVCLPFMKRRARAHMVPYIVAMRYSHERYSDQTPDWVREAIASIIENSAAPEKIDLMQQLESSSDESIPAQKKKQKGKGKKKQEEGAVSNMQIVASSKEAEKSRLHQFGESIPVVHGSSKKSSAKASTSKKRKADESSLEPDQSDGEKAKKKRSRTKEAVSAEPPVVVVDFVEDDEAPPTRASVAARMLCGHISSIAIPMKHAKGDGVKLASYIASNLGYEILKGTAAMLDEYCHDGKFEIRANGDVHYIWKGMFKKSVA